MVRRYQSGGVLRQLTPTRVAAASRRALSSDLAAALGGGPAAAPMTSGAGGTGSQRSCESERIEPGEKITASHVIEADSVTMLSM